MQKVLKFLFILLPFSSSSQESSPSFSVFYSPIHTIGFDQTHDIGTEFFFKPNKSIQFIYGFAGEHAFKNDNKKTQRFHATYKNYFNNFEIMKMGSGYWATEFMYKNAIENKWAYLIDKPAINPQLNVNVFALNAKLGYTYFPNDIFPYLDFSFGLGIRYRHNTIEGLVPPYELESRGKIYSRRPDKRFSPSINFGLNVGFGFWHKSKP